MSFGTWGPAFLTGIWLTAIADENVLLQYYIAVEVSFPGRDFFKGPLMFQARRAKQVTTWRSTASLRAICLRGRSAKTSRLSPSHFHDRGRRETSPPTVSSGPSCVTGDSTSVACW